MKNFCLLSALCFLTSSLLFGVPPERQSFSLDPFEVSFKKSHHREQRGPRGHKGHRGHRGHRGPTGAAAREIQPAYISLAFNTPPVDISPQDGSMPLIPFGQIEDQPAAFLEYIDPDPSDPLADRYIRVLPGGTGLYIIVFSMYTQTSNYINQPQVVFQGQPQFDFGLGWETSLPFNTFQTVFTPGSQSGQAYFSSAGTTQAQVYLHEGDKFRVAVLSATQFLSIGLAHVGPLVNRDVALSMNRIAY